jgi:hypothetical protein
MDEATQAKIFGCTVAQVRAQHARNADVLAGMLSKAESTGRKVNGYTADELRTLHQAAQRRAAGQ